MLTDANGEERKGIEVDLMSHTDGDHIHVWYCVPATECLFIASNCPPLILTDREEKTVRDLMLAGF